MGYFAQAETEPVEGVAASTALPSTYGCNRPRSGGGYLYLKTFALVLIVATATVRSSLFQEKAHNRPFPLMPALLHDDLIASVGPIQRFAQKH